MDSSISVLRYIFWFFCFYFSFFFSLWLRRRQKRKEDIGLTVVSETTYLIIKGIGQITLVIAFIYYIILFGILEWKLRWHNVSFLLYNCVIVVLDIFLIAIYYTKEDFNKKIFGIRAYWPSKIYTYLRVGIVSFFSFGLFVGTVSSVLLFLILFEIAANGTPEIYIGIIKTQFVVNKSSKNNNPFKNNREWDDWISQTELLPSNQDKNHDFVNQLIFEPKEYYLAIYVKKGYLFKKYLYSIRKPWKKQLYYSTNNDTLFIGKSDNYIPENYITKQNNVYIHTITKLKSNIPDLSYEEKGKLTLKTDPDKYETFTKIIK